MKKNNKGFLLAESLVVSTFVLTVLILLYVQFSNLTANYKNSYNYNNVESIYDLSSVADYLQKNNYNLSSKLTKQKPYVIVFEEGNCNMDAGLIDPFCDNLINKMGAKKIIYTSSDISIIQKYVAENEDNNIKQNLRDFISKVETNTVQNKGRLFAEFNNGTYATIAIDEQTNIQGGLPVGGTTVDIVTEGDGLYKDEYEEGRYIYKGGTPNNYIIFNNETWRILSVEADGKIKIVRNEALPEEKGFDSQGLRDSSSNGAGGTYCALGSYGCNAWATSDNFVNGSKSGTVLKDAELNVYLNGEYLNGITANKDKIETSTWNVGPVVYNNTDLNKQVTKDEKSVTWNGNVGLITASEYIRASNNSECKSQNDYYSNSSCYNSNSTHNWLHLDTWWWTLSPFSSDSFSVFRVHGGGHISHQDASFTYGVRPAIYLSSNLTLTGTGTKADPYKIGGSL